MISPQSISAVLDASRIEEVISDFVTLKRRGSNFIANCPFHNESTPSFVVSPAKGIYKCFGCSAAGNSLKFVMEHEKLSYPDAIRYLAKKYHITLEETATDAEAIQQQNELDKLYIVNNFAANFFKTQLLETAEGKNIALAYFKERGFRTDTLEKFGLGFAPNGFNILEQTAEKKGFNTNILQKLGLVKANTEGKVFDFFRNRAMFTIHNLAGKPIAFAGRIIGNNTDKKQPKYINSPETAIYVKSKVVYGMFQARKTVQQQDECLLVEGYTDVLSLHQAGIENVVASSGTALTVEQLQIIKRYTSNLTILYDGDPAGIKAALRGIDLALEQDLNVRIVLLPNTEDPDSMVRKVGNTGFKTYIEQHKKDFVLFKTELIVQEIGNDPIKKAILSKDIIQTITKVNDAIKRSLYIKSCANILDIDEQIIINETNKLKIETAKRQKTGFDSINKIPNPITQEVALPQNETITENDNANAIPTLPRNELIEQELIRVLLDYGQKEMELGLPVALFLLHEIEELPLENVNYQAIINEYLHHLNTNGRILDSDFFLSHPNQQISVTAATLLFKRYETSPNWEVMHNIIITNIAFIFKKQVIYLINNYKLSKVNKYISTILEELKHIPNSNVEAQNKNLEHYQRLLGLRAELAERLGIAIL